jgi:molybdopterin/thiamine biosynthesis adenylyltransferase
VAVLLAECGVRNLRIIDRDQVRPGNVVRHVATSRDIGLQKVDIVKSAIGSRTPWVNVESNRELPWSLERIDEVTEAVDLAVDATGYWSFCRYVSAHFERLKRPLVSSALYRAGAIGRVRRQVLDTDTPIYRRSVDSSHPEIPVGESGETGSLEIGCSAPVNNASPASVASIAALTVHVILDVLAERFEYPDEVVEVYRAVDTPPFDMPGRVEA